MQINGPAGFIRSRGFNLSDYNGLSVEFLNIMNIGGGELNVNIEPMSGSCDSPAPWITVPNPVFNGLIPGIGVATPVIVDQTTGDRLLPDSYVFGLCITTNQPAQPERVIYVDGASDVIFRNSFEDL